MVQAQNPYDSLPPVPSFTLTSDDIAEGQPLATPFLSGVFGAGGEDRSPHLAWRGFPDGTRSFAVTCFDPDAPTGSGFWHWALFNLPASVTELPSGADNVNSTQPPHGATSLIGDSGLRGYLGAAPPPGHGPHRYIFAVHALDVESLDVGADSRCAFLGFNMFGHTLARATLTAYHENKG